LMKLELPSGVDVEIKVWYLPTQNQMPKLKSLGIFVWYGGEASLKTLRKR
jgi:hypothetical protein